MKKTVGSRLLLVLQVGCALFALWAAVAPLLSFAAPDRHDGHNDDRTDATLDEHRRQGLEDLSQTVLPGGMKLSLHVSGAALAIIKKLEFDKPDASFDLDRFAHFVIDTFSGSLAYFATIIGEPALVGELHVIIDDKGDERQGTISEAVVGTRVIELDIRRWDKLKLGYHRFLADATSIHEFTHVATYQLNEHENRKHRELIAIIFEGLNLVRKLGLDCFENGYLRSTSNTLADRSEVLGEGYHGNDALRYIARSFIVKVERGAYSVQGDRTKALERFAAADLKDRSDGPEAFNHSLRAISALDSAGKPLTLETIQTDVYNELENQ